MANLPRNMIQLVKNPEEATAGADADIATYWTPPFLSLATKYEAMDLMESYQKWISGELGREERKELIDKVMSFVSETLYGKQFTKDELEKGIYGPTAFDELLAQVSFASIGEQTEETKKFLEKKN